MPSPPLTRLSTWLSAPVILICWRKSSATTTIIFCSSLQKNFIRCPVCETRRHLCIYESINKVMPHSSHRPDSPPRPRSIRDVCWLRRSKLTFVYASKRISNSLDADSHPITEKPNSESRRSLHEECLQPEGNINRKLV